jgi:hypothetical protein
MGEKISVPIDSKILGEMFLRRGLEADISLWVEDVVSDYLERTADEGDWNDAYYKFRESQTGAKDFAAKFGNPKEGYHWAPLFLPNGTAIRMPYKKETSHATVRFGKIDFNGHNYSASELARVIANNTSRNAWRDLWIKRPGDSQWILADELRRRMVK